MREFNAMHQGMLKRIARNVDISHRVSLLFKGSLSLAEVHEYVGSDLEDVAKLTDDLINSRGLGFEKFRATKHCSMRLKIGLPFVKARKALSYLCETLSRTDTGVHACDHIRRKITEDHANWFAQVVPKLGEPGVLALLLFLESELAGVSAYDEQNKLLSSFLVGSITPEQKLSVVALAKESDSLLRLYKLTSWPEAMHQAKNRSLFLAHDMSL